MSENTEDRIEHRLYIINRSGVGEIYYLLVKPELSHIDSYRLKTEKWPQIEHFSNFGTAVVDSILYVMGGYDHRQRKCTDRVLSYNPVDGSWTKKSSMFYCRSKFSATVLDGQIHVAGGERTDGKVMGSCERYDPHTDVWTKTNSLVSPRANHAVVTIGQEIYCTGGTQGPKCYNNLWVNEGRKWEELDQHYPQKLPANTSRHIMVVADNTLYVTAGLGCEIDEGGQISYSTQRGTVAFTPKVPTLDQTSDHQLISPWDRLLPEMNHARHSAGAVVLGQRIYVFGGTRLESGEEVKTSEYFDTKERCWRDGYKFRKGISGLIRRISERRCAIGMFVYAVWKTTTAFMADRRVKFSNVWCTLIKVVIPPEPSESPTNYKWVMW